MNRLDLADVPSLHPLCDDNVVRIKDWLLECDENHIQCQSARVKYSPTRLVDVSRSNTVSIVTCGQQLQRRYAALSYCWGSQKIGESKYMTTRANFQERSVSFSPTELPQTLQDAICVAQTLAIPFIWIDSLCIIQDEPGDW